jgi:hypothetical protein
MESAGGGSVRKTKFDDYVTHALSRNIVRMVLGLLTFFGWHQLSRGIRHQFGRTTSLLFMMVSSVQFHWLFYAGRTLPNTFALAIGKVLFPSLILVSLNSLVCISKQKSIFSLSFSQCGLLVLDESVFAKIFTVQT